MIRDVILPDTGKEEWREIRARLQKRILDALGEVDAPLTPQKNRYEIVREYEAFGLKHLKLRYEVLPDEWADAVCVLPECVKSGSRAKAVITIHGTNGESGKDGMLDPVNMPRRAYAIELARRGYVTIAPDSYGYGEAIRACGQRAFVKAYYEKHPNGSMILRRLLGNIRALDVLDQLEFVEKGSYGAIGNSLGGQSTLFLSAFDERVGAAVVSCGLSPNVTNVYRLGGEASDERLIPSEHPSFSAQLGKTGRTPWEVQELLALCAPRPVLVSEPFNDPYNPYVEMTVSCVLKASKVYELLEAPEHLSLYLHGDHHDTVDEVRDLAYDWIARWIGK